MVRLISVSKAKIPVEVEHYYLFSIDFFSKLSPLLVNSFCPVLDNCLYIWTKEEVIKIVVQPERSSLCPWEKIISSQSAGGPASDKYIQFCLTERYRANRPVSTCILAASATDQALCSQSVRSSGPQSCRLFHGCKRL